MTSIPTAWKQQPVSATGYLDPSGNPAVGNVTLTMSQGVVFNGEVIAALVLVFPLDATGSFVGTAPVNDDTGLGPYTGWTYNVDENFFGGRTPPYSIIVTTAGGAVDLATADQVIPAAQVSAFLKKTDVDVIIPSEASFNTANAAHTAYTDAQVSGEASIRSGADSNLQSQITTLSLSQNSGQVGYTTLAGLSSDLNHAAGTHGWVSNDPTPANNGDYIKLGAANAGSWQQSPSPYTAVTAEVGYIAQNFDAAPTTNLCNPARTDPWFATDADQLYRAINPGGALAAQNITTSGTFAVPRRVPVVAHQSVVLSEYNAPSGWAFYLPSLRLDWYNPDFTYNQETTTGFTVNGGQTPTAGMLNVHSIEIANPPITGFLGANLRNTADFSNSNPATVASFAQCTNAMMLNAGATAADFVPFAPVGKLIPDPVAFNLSNTKPITVVIQTPYVFVRTAMQLDTVDLVQRVLFAQPPSAAQSGVVDFYGVRKIQSNTPASNTIGGWNKAATILDGGIDEADAVKADDEFVWANHGKIGYNGASIAHGKTTADIGSIYGDGAVKLWTLFAVIDANTALCIPNNTGASDKWIMGTNPPTGLTLTHVSGGVHTSNFTATSWTQTQFRPLLRNVSSTLLADGLAITADGVYSCNDFRIVDTSEGLNPASQQAFLNSNIGSTDYTNAAVATQCYITNGFSWNRWGSRTAYGEKFAAQGWRVTAGAPGGYVAGSQQQRPSLDTDSTAGAYHTILFFAPDQTTLINGVDYSQAPGSTVANFVADTPLPASGSATPAAPAWWFAMVGKDGSGNILGGYIAGLSPLTGYGDPTTRGNSVLTEAYVSQFAKLYIVTRDSKLGDMAANTSITSTSFKAFFSNTDANFFIPGVIVDLSATKRGAFAACVGAVSPAWLALPKELQGQPVSILWQDHNNRATLMGGPNAVVGPKGVRVTTTGACSFVLLIG